MAMSVEDDLELSSYVTQRMSVVAWAIDPPPSNLDDDSPVDTEVVVNMFYRNYNDGSSRNEMFRIMREEMLMDDLDNYNSQEQMDTVVEWLEELGVEDDTAFRAAIDVVSEGFEQLVEQVHCRNRKSLAMMVEIEVLVDLDQGNNQRLVDDVDNMVEWEEIEVYDTGDVVEMDDEMIYSTTEIIEDEGVNKEARRKVAKEILCASGVKFGCVCSTSTVYGTDDSCEICLDEFEGTKTTSSKVDQDQDQVALLPCAHMLHRDCLLPWITKGNSTCPLCRSTIILPIFQDRIDEADLLMAVIPADHGSNDSGC